MTTKEQILKVCEYASGEHSTKVLCAMVNALPREKILDTSRRVNGIFEVLDILWCCQFQLVSATNHLLCSSSQMALTSWSL